MSLAIDTNKIKWVMIGGSWQEIVKGSFDLDAYEFESEGKMILGGGDCKQVTSTGAFWVNMEERATFCPLTSIQAVSY